MRHCLFLTTVGCWLLVAAGVHAALPLAVLATASNLLLLKH